MTANEKRFTVKGTINLSDHLPLNTPHIGQQGIWPQMPRGLDGMRGDLIDGSADDNKIRFAKNPADADMRIVDRSAQLGRLQRGFTATDTDHPLTQAPLLERQTNRSTDQPDSDNSYTAKQWAMLPGKFSYLPEEWSS
jgi:hypothetical protein